MLGQPLARNQVFLHQDRNQRGEAPGVSARLDRQMKISHLRRLTASRIDHHDRAVGVFGNLAQRGASASEAVRLPGVLTYEDSHLAMLEVTVYAGTQHPAIHPKLAGLFLRKSVGTELRAERLQRAVGIRTAEM